MLNQVKGGSKADSNVEFLGSRFGSFYHLCQSLIHKRFCWGVGSGPGQLDPLQLLLSPDGSATRTTSVLFWAHAGATVGGTSSLADQQNPQHVNRFAHGGQEECGTGAPAGTGSDVDQQNPHGVEEPDHRIFSLDEEPQSALGEAPSSVMKGWRGSTHG